jgi:hypothetical protein
MNDRLYFPLNFKAIDFQESGFHPYNGLSSLDKLARNQWLNASTRLQLCPGSMIFRWNSQPQPQTLKITEPLRPDADFRIDGWKSGWHKYRFNEHGEVLDNSWIRYFGFHTDHSSDVLWL